MNISEPARRCRPVIHTKLKYTGGIKDGGRMYSEQLCSNYAVSCMGEA